MYLWIVIVGAMFAFLAAMGIEQNDAANAFATAVGSKALSIKLSRTSNIMRNFRGNTNGITRIRNNT